MTIPVCVNADMVFSYDALGRQAPWPGVPSEWRYETYLNDGDRRIAERWDDPLFNSNNGGNNANQPPQVSGRVVRTEREYVYTPGYIDEFIAEYDSTGDYWPILQDANANAVAMTDDTGVVVRQRVYSPYGRLLATENLTSATPPKSRVGHQGLFAERLDASTIATPLASGSVLAWHNRNRSLLSEHGRFAQRDPNAMGQGARGSLNQGGSTILDTLAAADPLGLFGDGVNIYAYAQASPTQWQDPSGLIAGMFMPGPSDFVTGALEGLVNQYSANLSWDLEWALDWDMPDEMHTRGSNDWMPFAMMQGVYDSYYIGIPGTDIGFNPLDAFASGRRRGPADDGYNNPHGKVPHFGKMRAIYSQWKKVTGVSGLMMNKAVRDKNGNVMRDANGKTLRPDVQFWYKGKLFVYEVWSSRGDPGKEALYNAIMKNNGVTKWKYKGQDVP